MTTHDLKCDATPFQKLVDGDKKFEVRHERDRKFAVGDELRLHEQTDDRNRTTGCVFNAKVSYILRGPAYGLPEKLCVMSLCDGFLTAEKKDA